RALSQDGPSCWLAAPPGSAEAAAGSRSRFLSRVELTVGRRPALVGGGRTSTCDSDASASRAALLTSPARSGAGGDEASTDDGWGRVGGRGAHSASRSSPRARRSAALPASPCPSSDELRELGVSFRGVPAQAAAP